MAAPALNYPNITIYGIADLGGAQALVLEFVEGETLAEILRGHVAAVSSASAGAASPVG